MDIKKQLEEKSFIIHDFRHFEMLKLIDGKTELIRLSDVLEILAIQVEAKVMQKPKPKTLQAIFEIVDNIDFELAQLEDIAKGEIGEKITLLRKYIDENRVSA